jgi:hypothetical protein
LALLLGIVFLTAQFHFCADLTDEPTGSHLCPLCTTAGSAIVTPSPSIALAPALGRLENLPRADGAVAAVPRDKSSRAPPSC